MTSTELNEAVRVAAEWRRTGRGQVPVVKPVPAPKVYLSQSPKANRARYLKMQAGKPMTDHRAKYGKMQVQAMFMELAEKLGISPSAARMRHYRGQI